MEKIKRFVTEHPQWTSWIVLAIGMVAILVWSARDVGLLPGQWAALIIATILVAGLAVWIIGWEDEDEEEEADAAASVDAAASADADVPADSDVAADADVSVEEDAVEAEPATEDAEPDVAEATDGPEAADDGEAEA